MHLESLLDSGTTNIKGIVHLRKVEVWYQVCCYGGIITIISMCSSCSTSTLQNFLQGPCRFSVVFAQIFHILLFYIILCPHGDITSPSSNWHIKIKILNNLAKFQEFNNLH